MTAAYDFRKEEDVQEYLHNIGIEYRFGCYSEQKPEVCHLLGMYLEVIKQNVEQAKKVFKVNCDNYKWDFSCYRYAYLLDHEKKPENNESTLDYYKKGCEAGNSKSCYMAGVKTGKKAENEEDFDKKKNLYQQALKYMHKACDEKLGEACFNLFSIYITGIDDIKMPPDLTEAFDSSVKGCDNFHLQSCVNTSLMYLKGDIVEKNVKKAREYQKKAKELEQSMSGEGVKFEEGLSNT